MKCDVSRLAAALRRRHVLVFTEQSAEVIDAAEADFFSDMCNVQFGLGNQFLGLVNAVLIQEFDKCPARRLLESPAEMKSAHVRDGCRLLDRNRISVTILDEQHHFLQLLDMSPVGGFQQTGG